MMRRTAARELSIKDRSEISKKELARYIPDPKLSNAPVGSQDQEKILANKERQQRYCEKGRKKSNVKLEEFSRNLLVYVPLYQPLQYGFAYLFDGYCKKVINDRSIERFEPKPLLIEICGTFDCYRDHARQHYG